MINFISVALVGGSSDNEGNVFATNPTTGLYGPVCDDGWAIEEVCVLEYYFHVLILDSFENISHLVTFLVINQVGQIFLSFPI